MPVPEDGAAAWGRSLAAALLLAMLPGAWAQQPAPARLALCAACHGEGGNSQIPQFPSLAGQPRQFIENQLVLIREGLRDIPQMKGLLDGVKDDEIVILGKYFSEQAPAAVKTRAEPGAYQRGMQLSQKMLCGTCHLPDYSGRQQIPRLAGQNEPFLVESMKQFRDHPGLGRDTVMAAALFGLKDPELADLAHFLTHFKP